jgi:hypothetical protein
MNLRLTAACAAMAFACASPAFAEVTLVATLAAPLAHAGHPLAGEVIWRCAADSCTTSEATVDTLSLNTCKALARQVGAISAFRGVGRELSAADLERCNAVAHPAPAAH